MTAELVAEIEALHAPETYNHPSGKSYKVCGECISLCHSHSGLMCDEPVDGMWPCLTMRIVERYKK